MTAEQPRGPNAPGRSAASGSNRQASPEPDPTVQGLARLVDRAVRRLEQLDGRVSGLAEIVTDLALKLTPPAPDASGDHGVPPTSGETGPDVDLDGQPEPPAVRSWLLADDVAQADADLADLSSWLWRVYLWWPDAWLASCWLWHPEVIEELWWLRVAHADAYHRRTGTSLRVADWHERHRPGVARRVGTILRSCELTRHIPFNGRPVEVTPPGPPALARHAPAIAEVWATGAGMTDVVRAAGPQPSPQQLGEADAYQQALYRSRR